MRPPFPRLLLALCLTTTAFGGSPEGEPLVRRPADDQAAAPDELIVRIRPQAPDGEQERLLRREGLRVTRAYSLVPGLRKLSLADDQADLDRARLGAKLRRLKESGLYDYVEPDRQVRALQLPNDDAFADGTLWGLRNTGQNGGTAGIDVNATAAWSVTAGSPAVVVGVVDTGIRYTHTDLAPNLWSNPGEIPGNGIDDDGNGYIDDVHGIDAITGSGDPFDDNDHGSHVAGTIAARANGGGRHVGVAHDVRIMALKFLGADGAGSLSGAIECIEYAVASGVDVLNNSWGGGGYSQALRDTIEAAGESGILFIAAAGNESSDSDLEPAYPAGYNLPNVISVAAVDRRGNLANFSNYGARTVDLAAPGVAILSCTAVSDTSYASFQGTSMACPHVAGVAALLRSHHPAATVLELRNRLLNTTSPLPSLSGRTVTGGLVDARAALDVEADGVLEITATPDGSLTAGNTALIRIAVTDLLPVSGASVSAAFDGAVPQPFRDDGSEPDGTAGDGIYTGTLPVPSTDSTVLNIQVSAPGKQPASRAIPLPVTSAPPNDDFADRIVLGASTTRTTGTNRVATREPGELVRPSVAGDATVWWEWTPTVSLNATISTAGSNFDTTLAVFRGSTLGGLTTVASNDDSNGLQSSVTFSATAGTSYQIQVAGFQSATGDIQLNYPAPGGLDTPVIVSPPSGREVLIGDPFSLSVIASGANPLTYQWRRDGTLLPNASSPGYTVAASTEADEGNYTVTVTNSFGSATSDPVFVAVESVALLPDNDSFAEPVELPALSGTVTGSNVRATGEAGEPNHASASDPLASVWYRWTAPGDGILSLSLAGSDYDTTLAVYTGGTLGGLSAVASNDDSSGFQSALDAVVSAGTTYHIAVDGFSDGEGTITLDYTFAAGVDRPANDDFANAIELHGSTSVAGSNVGATGEPGEPSQPLGASPLASVWWSWTAPASGSVLISTDFSQIDTTLAVYTGNDVQSLTLIAENDDTNELWSEVAFPVIAGTTYRIAVDGYATDQGQLLLTLDYAPSADLPEILLLDDQQGFAGAAEVLRRHDYILSIFGQEFDFDYEFLLDPVFLERFDLVVYGERGSGEGAALPSDVADSLESYLQSGGHVLVTGHNALGGPPDPELARLVRALPPADLVSETPTWSVSTLDHPILNGPYGDFRGRVFEGTVLDDDRLDPDTTAGAIELISTGAPRVTGKLIFTDLPGAGGSVGFWNGGLPGTSSEPQPEFSSGGAPEAIFLNYVAHVTGLPGTQNPEIKVEIAGIDQPDGGAALTFGPTAMNDSLARTITVLNTGTTRLGGLGLSLAGSHPSDFSVSGLPPTLEPGDSASTTIRFEPGPSSSGPRDAVLSIRSNDSDEDPFDLPLSGSAASALALFQEAAGDAGLGPAANPGGTPFGDGVPNLLKYAFNLPLDQAGAPRHSPGAESGLPLVLPERDESALEWSFEYVRRRGSGLLYQPMLSDSLSSFSPVDAPETVVPIDARWERVRIHIRRDLTDHPRGFGYVEVDFAP